MIHTHTLSNGLRIIHRPFPSGISYCGIVVNAGSRDEYPDEFGMAHFVEHMLFKGTERRKAHHIASRMENVGGELNAYTTKEETFFYATFLEEYFSRATELLGDILFHSVFSPGQIEREREVILDEINSYHDSPSELIYDDFENMLYKGHEMGHYILGEPEALHSFSRERILSFMQRQYQPSEMVFFSFGKTAFEKVIRQVEKYFCMTQEAIPQKRRTPPGNFVPHREKVDKNTTQTHVMLGCSTFSMHHSQKYALFMLNNILGGDSLNSRLNASLREKHGLAYHVESNVTLYSDNGLFSVYFACDPKYRDKCIRLVGREIDKIKKTDLTPMQLALAKKQWKGQMGIAAESHENSALAMAKQYLHFNCYTPLEDLFSRIDALTSKQVKEVAEEIFAAKPFELIYY
ncbi:M16 family metallopeptidase [Proteiniphilum sp. UBA1028]|jgi:predicted Zn-dependent peptidase|uniref:M16 family metallopeptidase n=1 Tax=Proteiniphilum sp. UBA1028 TaxID=1947251 RepID=UPI0025FB5A14|nr:pitrilysin family protein [Proteiniphilum sp. UBA1028]